MASDFASLKAKLSKKPGVYSPGGLAQYIGKKKLGAAEFNRRARKGRRRMR